MKTFLEIVLVVVGSAFGGVIGVFANWGGWVYAASKCTDPSGGDAFAWGCIMTSPVAFLIGMGVSGAVTAKMIEAIQR